MKDSFYCLPRPCFVYLLVLDVDEEEPFYYVGKSFATSMSKVYSRHIHSGFAPTRNIFSVEAQPKLYILQNRPLTGDESYRYVVAYTKFFSDNALGESLNYDETEWQSRHLKPETEAIYHEISQEPLPDLLKRTYIMRPVDADRKKESALSEQKNKRTVQLNVSVYEDDKALFDAYCKKTGVSRRDALGMLLESAATKTTDKYEQIIIGKERKIESQSQEIKKLERKLALATGRELPKKEIWASRMYPIMLDGIKRYIGLLFPRKEATLHPIQSRSYKGFTKPLLSREEYVYPEKEGFYLIRLQAVLWGKNRSCFYIGVDSKDRRYRMRYYDKDWFMGIPPKGSGYDEQDSIWLCGVVKAPDGAMDLVAAMPLPHIKSSVHVPKDGRDRTADQQKKPALADRIIDIEGR